MKIVRISVPEHREWRINMSRVVDDEGISIREITLDEGAVFRELDKQALASRKPISAIMDEGTADARTLTVTPTLGPSNVVTLERTVDDKKVVDGRHAMMNAFRKTHGDEFQLRTVGGKFPIKTSHGKAGRHTASPAGGACPSDADHCPVCQQFAGRQAGRHHKICLWNDRAPVEQRALDAGVVLQANAGAVAAPMAAPVAPKVRFLPQTGAPAPMPAAFAAAAPPAAAAVPSAMPSPFAKTGPVINTTGAPVVEAPPAAPSVFSPGTCPNNCTKWAQYEGTGHHAICQHREPWEASQAGGEPRMLVDLDTGVAVREATPDEITEAAGNLGVATVSDRTYGVVPASEIVPRAPAPAPASP